MEEALTPIEVRPGLRERKKQKTRETIARVALELFARQGYERTTIAEIAEAAEVSPRTIFAYFASKEDILFCDIPEMLEHLARSLRERPAGTTTLDVLREFIAASLTPTPTQLLRKQVLASDEALRVSGRARFAAAQQLLVGAIAEDLDAGPDDSRPRIVAASLFAAVDVLHDPSARPESFSPEHAMALLDDVVTFLQGGLDALRQA